MKTSFVNGEIISYMEMTYEERINLQRGMNFRIRQDYSIILMSLRKNAPYADRIEDSGKTLIYEGHDVPKTGGITNPKEYDQPMKYAGGSLTQNGKFYEAAIAFKENIETEAELVKVYEKIQPGIWTYNGVFKLVDAWTEESDGRQVFKFKLIYTDLGEYQDKRKVELAHNRFIPSEVKFDVYKRDEGKCVICGAKDNLHYDHDFPFAKGGSSITSENIRILCARHNLEKSDKIE